MVNRNLLTRLCLLVALALSPALLMAQTAAEFINEGIALHDKGEYAAAIEKYRRALQLEPNNTWAQYEICLSYFDQQEYSIVISKAEKLLKVKGDIGTKAVWLYAASLDYTDEPQRALDALDLRLKEEGMAGQGLLLRTKAIVLQRMQRYREAQNAALEGVGVDPKNGSMIQLVGGSAFLDDRLVEGVLCYPLYLAFSERTTRTEGHSKHLAGWIMQVAAYSQAADDRAFTLSEQKAFQGQPEPANATAADAAQAFELLLKRIQKQQQQRGTFGPMDAIIDRLIVVQNAGLGQTLVYYASRFGGDEKVANWLGANDAKVKALEKLLGIGQK